jgi:hypothetical protein
MAAIYPNRARRSTTAVVVDVDGRFSDIAGRAADIAAASRTARVDRRRHLARLRVARVVLVRSACPDTLRPCARCGSSFVLATLAGSLLIAGGVVIAIDCATHDECIWTAVSRDVQLASVAVRR